MAEDSDHSNETLSPPSQDLEPSYPAAFQGAKEEIGQLFTSITSSGFHSCNDSFIDAPDPDIYVANGGRIAIPLLDDDAQELIAASREFVLPKDEEIVSMSFQLLASFIGDSLIDVRGW